MKWPHMLARIFVMEFHFLKHCQRWKKKFVGFRSGTESTTRPLEQNCRNGHILHEVLYLSSIPLM